MDKTHPRFTPGWFRAWLSRAYRRLEYHAGVRSGRRDPLTPPDWLDPGGRRERFSTTGDEFFQYFIRLCDLKPHEGVLDVGCGTGRMARPLTKYLKGGSYDGLDIVAPSVKWCRKAYGGRHPDFRFHHSDLYNKAYNPGGRGKAFEYRFPFADSSFDLVILTSVFTHMLSRDVAHYLSEVSRVLRSGGRCLITYFLLNQDSLKLIEEKVSLHDFGHRLPGCFVQNIDVPEAVVAYEEGAIRELYRRNGLLIAEPIRYGGWCGRPDGLSKQDIIIASKPRA